MPFLFYLYGKKIRAKSKFSPAPDIAQDKRRDEEARLAADGESSSTTQGSEMEPEQEKKETATPDGNRDNNLLAERKETGSERRKDMMKKTYKDA